MRRREFITLLGGATVTWPLTARGQQSERARRIGILMGFAENDEVWQAYLASFRRSLKALGWVEDRNIRFDYRFAGDSPERTRAAAEELVALAPDVIFVSTNPALSAAMEATRLIPIVFTWVSDSVGSGYVASLAHPGGNVTGFHNFEPAFGGKWLEVLKEVAPNVRRVAVLHVPEISANLARLRSTETASKALGITVIPAAVRNADDVERVLSPFARERAGRFGGVKRAPRGNSMGQWCRCATAEHPFMPVRTSFHAFVSGCNTHRIVGGAPWCKRCDSETSAWCV